MRLYPPLHRFTEHLEDVGETYVQHLAKAAGFSAWMLAAGIACLVHALFPFLFVKTGSDCIRRLHRLMVENRGGRRKDEAVDEVTPPSCG